ncbi:MAG: ArsR/SmtB family transcription factor [Methanobacteriota archaeon]
MRTFKVIKDPEAFQLLADETRRRVLYLLRAKDMTVSQLAEQLDRTPQAIYHHIRKLKDAGMVEVAREERVDHFIETYYRAAAELFHLAHGEGGALEDHERHTKEALKALSKVGFTVEADDETVAKIVELERRMEKIGLKPEIVEKISELEDVDFPVKWGLDHYSKLLSMTDAEFDEVAKLSKELRKILRTKLLVPTKGPTPR